jgi:hypothetical protein
MSAVDMVCDGSPQVMGTGGPKCMEVSQAFTPWLEIHITDLFVLWKLRARTRPAFIRDSELVTNRAILTFIVVDRA